MVEEEEVSKKSLREYALNKRKNLQNKKIKENIIVNKILNHKIVKKSENILLYMSTIQEVSTFTLIDKLIKKGKNIYAPRIVDKNIEFYKIINMDDLSLNKYKILEPKPIDKFVNDERSVIIVPGLLFDLNNNRLGYGGGYYDRYLRNLNIYKIGICFQDFIINNLPVDEFDVKVDEVICEN